MNFLVPVVLLTFGVYGLTLSENLGVSLLIATAILASVYFLICAFLRISPNRLFVIYFVFVMSIWSVSEIWPLDTWLRTFIVGTGFGIATAVLRRQLIIKKGNNEKNNHTDHGPTIV